MGNKQTEKFEWEKKFAILQKNFNDNTLVLQKFQGGHECIGRQIVSTDTKQSQEIKRLIKLKYNKNNPFLTKLMQIYYNNNEGYCSPEDKIFLVFQKPKQTLRQQILARKFANQPFTEQEADIILQSGCKAIRSLKQLSHPHNNVSTSSIFIDQDRRIVLGDPWITPPIYSQDINQNVFACPSPQKILLQNDQILSICPYKSDLFSLGTVVLQVLNFQHMDILYEKGFRRLIQSKVQEKLQKIKNQQLKYKLSAVLSHDPNNRDQIFRFYRTTGFSASSVKNKVFNAYNISQTQQNRKQQVKSVQLNRKKQTKTLIQPKATSNAQKPIHTYNTNTNPNLKISSMPHSYYTNTQTVSQQPNYINSKTNISNNKLSFNPPSMIPSYKPSTTLAQTSHQASTFQNNITNNINRPNFQTSSNNLQTKNNSIPINNYHKNGFTNYNPGAINQTFNTNHQNHFNSGVLSSGGNLVVNYIPQFKVGNANDDERNTTVIPNTFIRIQKKEAISQNNGHVFQATIIKSSQQFVKTSGNIRYMQNLSKSQDSILKQQIENIQHVGNYGVKTEIGVIKPPLLTENTQLKVSKQPTNQISMKGKIDPFNSNKAQIKPQEKKLANQAKQTPERRPNNRKYNSTIKQDPDECSYSGSRDGDEEYQCVIQQYETGKYEGQKKNGMRNGFGKFIYNEGSVYQGNWKDNLMHGKGNLYYSDGKLAYEGDWRMDQFHGFGKVYNEGQLPIKGSYDYTDFSNVNDFWASYEGELNSDRRHGKGKIKFSNGQIFSGNFVADIVQGEGKFYSLSGQIIHGIWKNNKLLKKF